MKTAVHGRASLLLLILLALLPQCLVAQGLLRYNLDEKGETYLRASVRAQFWAQYTQLNPGSLIDGQPAQDHFDLSARRLRINLAGQVSPRLYFFICVGENNLRYTDPAAIDIRPLDYHVEYAFGKALEVGLGKSGWQGLSRWNVRSSRSMLGLDAPLFALSTVNRIDDLGRYHGLWLKGQAGRWDYRLAINQPRRYDSGTPGAYADFANIRPHLQPSAYLKYQFWDLESNKSAYSAGTYLGEKKVLNLGAGFMRQERAMWSGSESDTLYHPLSHFAADAFMELPLSTLRGDALNVYLGAYRYGFGPGYLRNLGANNPANGLDPELATFNGTGNAFPMMGTGNTVFLQIGYLLGRNVLGEGGPRLQPHFSMQYAQYERLDEPTRVYDLGLNVLFRKHASKLSLNAQSWPVYGNNSGLWEVQQRRAMLVMQYQIELN